MARARGKYRRDKSRFSVRKQRDKWEDLDVDGMTLKWILKTDWRARTGLNWPGVGPRGWGGEFSHGKYEEK